MKTWSILSLINFCKDEKIPYFKDLSANWCDSFDRHCTSCKGPVGEYRMSVPLLKFLDIFVRRAQHVLEKAKYNNRSNAS
jgi:hypothetical protein